MEKTIISQKISLDTAPVHIAPGGSVICHLVAPASVMAALLRALMEEIAYGMIDVETLNEAEKVVRVDIYFGVADNDDFMKVFSGYADKIMGIEREDLPEGTVRTGFSMSSRNAVINCLG